MKRATAGLLILLCLACASGALVPSNRYGLTVVGDPTTYRELVRRDPDKQLLDVSRAVPGVVLDVRYATATNFLH